MVAGWDRLAEVFRTDLPKTPDRAWSALGASFEPLWAHLEDTTLMAAASAFAGDLLATRWSTDTLLKWCKIVANRWDGQRTHLPVDDALATPALLQTPWAEATAELHLASLVAVSLGPTDAFAAVIENAWRDAQVLLLCVLGRWGFASGVNGTAVTAARAILRREVHDQDGLADDRSEHFALGSFLEAVIRSLCAGGLGADKSWSGRVSWLLDKLGHIEDRPRVSGRIYTSTAGFTGIHEFATEQAVYLMALAAQDCSPSGRLKQGTGNAATFDMLMLARFVVCLPSSKK